MIVRTALSLSVMVLLGACATAPTQQRFAGERTVFHNPYASPALSNGPVGPGACADQPASDQCWIEGLLYPGRGNFAYDRNGNRIQLSRSDRRELRRRFELIRDQAEINRRVAEFNAQQANFPPNPVPNAPPISDRTAGGTGNGPPDLGQPPLEGGNSGGGSDGHSPTPPPPVPSGQNQPR
ncbi:MAG: hypothetical protein ABJN35_00430 [Erythrobacter sp.]